MHSLKAILLFTIMTLGVASTMASSNLSGRLSNNANLYRLLPFPVDPNYAELEFTGHANRGSAVMRFRGPGDLCVQWPDVSEPICGKEANDYQVFIDFEGRDARLNQVINIPGPQSFGNATNMVVYGRWETQNRVFIVIEHTLEVRRSAFNFATVVITQSIAGQLTRKPQQQWDFTGQSTLMAVSYVVGQQTPFQVVTSFGDVQSGQLNIATPFAAWSPYPANPSAPGTNPAAPVFAVGNVTVVTMNGNVLQGKVSLKTPNNRIAVPQASMKATYTLDSADERVIHVLHAQLVDDVTGQRYFMNQFDIILNL